MNDSIPSRKMAARPHAGCFLDLFMLFGMPAALIPALLMLVLAGGATASAQVVTSSADSGPGTLRSAITNAAGGAVITFDPGLSGAVITLSNTLTINTNLTIDASALPGGLQINGNGSVQIFNVATNVTVFLNSLTITNGYSTNDGGGILNDGTLTLTNCTLLGNSAPYVGLGVGGLGGGIYNIGTLTLNQCTLSGNSAGSGGGIADDYGTLTMIQCTLSGNSATLGGGISDYVDKLTLNQCTLSGNSATDSGGGIFNNYEGALTLNQCTLSGNNYDGICYYRAGTVTMTNTIVAGNWDDDIDTYIYYPITLTYGGSNLVQSVYNFGGTITGPAPLTNAPDLAPLGNYGGPTQTMPPLPGSPAIDAGSNDATNDFATDQRGLPRFVGPQVDIGAVEFQASPVVTNADSGPGSLRYAIVYVTNNATITFDPGLSGATITLSNTLAINTNLTIDASALPGGLQINGNGSVEIFNVASSTATVFLNSLTITNGFTSGDGGGIGNYGLLTLNQCTLSGNYATNGNGGGGIYNGGTLALNQCTLSGNSANVVFGLRGGGGGIGNFGALTMNQCTLSGNSALIGGDGGGGIYNYWQSTMTLNQCTLSGNSASTDGGGIENFEGITTLNQCTLSGNSVPGVGGGIDNHYDGTLTLNQCTLSGNYANYGGGIFNGTANTLAMTNTIVGGNSSPLGADIYNTFSLTYGGSNLVQSVYHKGGGGFTGPAPLTYAPDLAPLGNYGGPTQTMPPLPGSPAIGAGSVADNTFSTDQRGYPRTQNGLIDLGAVELQSPAVNPPVLENLTAPAGGGNGLQFTFTNAPAADFTVLTATNVSLALTNWTVLGEVQQVTPGQYQFTDPQAATNTARFYRVRSP